MREARSQLFVRLSRLIRLLPLPLLLAGCGMSWVPSLSVGTFSRVPVPADIAPASNQKLEYVLAAKGVQIYRCDAKKDAPGQFEWTFQAPDAILRDPGGRYVGKHYAGPTWEAEDGSKVAGTVQARHDAGPRTIPWLRLGTRSTGGAGIFAGVTTIVRIDTNGGVAPASGCDAAEQGKILRVGYSADYNLYVTR
jgi:hypothetical protein